MQLRTSKWYRHKNRRVMSSGSWLNSGYDAMSVWDAAHRMQEVSPTTVVGLMDKVAGFRTALGVQVEHGSKEGRNSVSFVLREEVFVVQYCFKRPEPKLIDML
jgi:hypothetical protein